MSPGIMQRPMGHAPEASDKRWWTSGARPIDTIEAARCSIVTMLIVTAVAISVA